MNSDETYGVSYTQVDADPNAHVRMATMDETSRWPATVQLRTWERDQLQLRPAQRLLDVGCGLGDAGIALAGDLGRSGRLTGIDASHRMVAAARIRSEVLRCSAQYLVGDAAALGCRDRSFDAVRIERTLQWLADPRLAVAELARVVRPGGRVSLIDTDWSTFSIDIGDDDTTARIRQAMSVERARPSHVGSRLGALAVACGLEPLAHSSATQTWTEWDPDQTTAPDGCFSMTSLADDLVDTGSLPIEDREDFVARIHDAARRGRFRMSLTMHAVIARLPSKM